MVHTHTHTERERERERERESERDPQVHTNKSGGTGRDCEGGRSIAHKEIK